MKANTTQEPVFRCDCVKLKRAIQRKIYEETKYMTREQIREYTRKGAEEFDRKFEILRAERQAAESATLELVQNKD